MFLKREISIDAQYNGKYWFIIIIILFVLLIF